MEKTKTILKKFVLISDDPKEAETIEQYFASILANPGILSHETGVYLLKEDSNKLKGDDYFYNGQFRIIAPGTTPVSSASEIFEYYAKLLKREPNIIANAKGIFISIFDFAEARNFATN